VIKSHVYCFLLRHSLEEASTHKSAKTHAGTNSGENPTPATTVGVGKY